MSREAGPRNPVRLTRSERVTPEELALAARNHGMPLEALRWAVTPVGLHYLLTHYDIPAVDPGSFALTVDGRVANPRSWRPAELADRPARTLTVTMECAGNGRAGLLPRALSQPWLLEAVGTADWTGVPLRPLLEEAGPLDDAVEVVFTGLDVGAEVDNIVEPYQRALPIAEALGDDVLLAYGMNGGPLPPQHGFPLRLVVPGWYGMGNVKWLTRITVVSEPFTGFENRVSYRLRQTADEVGVPVTRMEPRALMIPPGAPDFFTRTRLLDSGPCDLVGRAWSGWAPITGVEVSVDGAATWHEARLSADPVSSHAWSSWSWTWDASRPGDYEVCCRARDGSGRIQPLEGPWNLHGFANNAVHRVSVTVR
ncbi:MAG TPA: sulfite oxidase [Acidimicrobiia bacterium]|nr:sulfite oxidase [Acidimicrobiia bacterium]